MPVLLSGFSVEKKTQAKKRTAPVVIVSVSMQVPHRMYGRGLRSDLDQSVVRRVVYSFFFYIHTKDHEEPPTPPPRHSRATEWVIFSRISEPNQGRD